MRIPRPEAKGGAQSPAPLRPPLVFAKPFLRSWILLPAAVAVVVILRRPASGCQPTCYSKPSRISDQHSVSCEHGLSPGPFYCAGLAAHQPLFPAIGGDCI